MEIMDCSDRLPSNFEWLPWGDLHRGNRDSKDKAIARFVDYIRGGKNRYFSLGGDQLECITPNDKRFDSDSHSGQFSRLTAQANDVIDTFQPIASKCLWILDGNHEHTVMNIGNFNKDIICRSLDIPYGTYTVKATLTPKLKVFDWHGAGVCNSRAGNRKQRRNNRENRVRTNMVELAHDVELMCQHHIHQTIINRPERVQRMIDDGKKLHYITNDVRRIPLPKRGAWYINEDDRFYCSSGSALGEFGIGYSGYAERLGLPPTDISTLKVTVKNELLFNVEEYKLTNGEGL